MAINIFEYDYGTKRASRQMLDKLVKTHPSKFRQMYFKWLQRVYHTVKKYCPVDTGALRASVRVVEGASPTSLRPKDMFKYTQAAGAQGQGGFLPPTETMLWIVAGGGGYINPKKGTEVDYAQAVEERTHFMGRAIRAELPMLEKIMNEHWKWINKQWVSNQPTIGGMWKLPTKLAGVYSHLVY